MESLNEDDTPIVELRVPAIIEAFENAIKALDSKPIIMAIRPAGRSQVLLDHGCGAVGVAMNSAPTEALRVVPPSQVKST